MDDKQRGETAIKDYFSERIHHGSLVQCQKCKSKISSMAFCIHSDDCFEKTKRINNPAGPSTSSHPMPSGTSGIDQIRSKTDAVGPSTSSHPMPSGTSGSAAHQSTYEANYPVLPSKLLHQKPAKFAQKSNVKGVKSIEHVKGDSQVSYVDTDEPRQKEKRLKRTYSQAVHHSSSVPQVSGVQHQNEHPNRRIFDVQTQGLTNPQIQSINAIVREGSQRGHEWLYGNLRALLAGYFTSRFILSVGYSTHSDALQGGTFYRAKGRLGVTDNEETLILINII